MGLFSMADSSLRVSVEPSLKLLSQQAVNTTDTTSTKRPTAAAAAMMSFEVSLALASFEISLWTSSLSKRGAHSSAFSTRIVFLN